MDLIIKFFTETPNATQVFYIIFIVSLVTYTLLKVLPEEKVIKWAVIINVMTRTNMMSKRPSGFIVCSLSGY